MSRFVKERKNNWQRLEELLENLKGNSLRRLTRAEVREFGELYRRAATDLAIARAETRDPKLLNYLNSLVIRAHGKIYRAENQGFDLIWQFFAKDFPNAVRRTWKFTFLAFAITMILGTASFLLCYHDQNFADSIGVGEVRYMAQNNIKWWESLNDANQIGATQILTNNIRVAFMAFALGAFFCIGAVYILALNGIVNGGLLGVCFKTNPDFGFDLVTFMIGHGVIELSCIFIAGGAGMSIGYSIINPGNLSRGQALKKAGMEAARIVIGCAILLFIAGIIEGFISPSALPVSVKFGVGILTGILMYSYLCLVGKSSESTL